MKVIYGGSFNPPTKAHLEISLKLYENYNIEELVFLPTANVYLKPDLAPIEDRIAMLLIMCKHLKNARVSDFEAKMSEYKGTSYTLQHFKGYYFLMGADNFDYIEKWIDFPNVVINNKFIIVPRSDFKLEEKYKSNRYLDMYRDNFLILDFEKNNISATEFRKTYNNEIVIDEIYEYINKKGLYK